MKLEVSAVMVIGRTGKDIYEAGIRCDLVEWADSNGLKVIQARLDAHEKDCFFGFLVGDIRGRELNKAWIEELAHKSRKFTAMTSLEAVLTAMPDVYNI